MSCKPVEEVSLLRDLSPEEITEFMGNVFHEETKVIIQDACFRSFLLYCYFTLVLFMNAALGSLMSPFNDLSLFVNFSSGAFT